MQWIPLITTKLIENVATHSRLYRLANQSVTNTDVKDNKSHQSPQRRATKKEQHRRNKSDTDLNWYLANVSMHRNVANSKFYTDHVDEKSLVDPEVKLLHAFFSICDTYRDECLDDEALESMLTSKTNETKLMTIFLYRIFDSCNGNDFVFHITRCGFRLSTATNIPIHFTSKCRTQTGTGNVVRSGFY